MEQTPITAIADSAVDARLDAELRTLLSSCFKGPEDHVFRVQRFFHVLPLHRWMIRDAQGLAAHIAIHDRTALHAGGSVRFAGVAEVCVRDDQRGRGLVRKLLERAHGDLPALGFAWAALFGNPKVYSSSGYRATLQPIRYLDSHTSEPRTEVFDYFMVASLSPDAPPWPAGEIDLQGQKF